MTYFEGSSQKDTARLTGQIKRIYNLMKDRQWRTLGEIEAETGDPQASISAQLRHLRKKRFGGHDVDKNLRNDMGLWEYRLIPNVEPVQMDMDLDVKPPNFGGM